MRSEKTKEVRSAKLEIVFSLGFVLKRCRILSAKICGLNLRESAGKRSTRYEVRREESRTKRQD